MLCVSLNLLPLGVHALCQSSAFFCVLLSPHRPHVLIPCAILLALLLLHSRLCHHNNLMYGFLWFQLDSSLSFCVIFVEKRNAHTKSRLKQRIHLLAHLWPYDFWSTNRMQCVAIDSIRVDPHAKWLLEFKSAHFIFI